MNRIAVVTAGLSKPSSTRLLADRLAAATVANAGEPLDVQVVELRELATDIAHNLVTGFPAGDLATAVDAVAKADGLIAVTPIFSASYSGLFKSFFDVLEPGTLDGKPVLLAATGGTARHSLALEHAVRPLFTYLRAVSVPTTVFAATDDWGNNGAGPLSERIDRAAAEFADLVANRRHARVADPYDNPVPFETLLADTVRTEVA